MEARKKLFRDNKEAKKEIKRYKKEATKGLKKFVVSNDANRAYKESKKKDTIKRNIEKMNQKRYDKNIDNIAAYKRAKKYGKNNEEQIAASGAAILASYGFMIYELKK